MESWVRISTRTRYFFFLFSIFSLNPGEIPANIIAVLMMYKACQYTPPRKFINVGYANGKQGVIKQIARLYRQTVGNIVLRWYTPPAVGLSQRQKFFDTMGEAFFGRACSRTESTREPWKTTSTSKRHEIEGTFEEDFVFRATSTVHVQDCP